MKKSSCPWCGHDVSNWVFDGWGFVTCKRCRITVSATEFEREGRLYSWERRRRENQRLL